MGHGVIGSTAAKLWVLVLYAAVAASCFGILSHFLFIILLIPICLGATSC